MTLLYRRTLVSFCSLALVATGLVVGAGPAVANHVACGQTIMVSTTLDGNVGPCTDGITIGANNVTLNLAGFSISGTTNTGEGPGVLIEGRTGVVVTGGTINRFDGGVSIEQGSGNRVTGMTLADNRSGFSDYGEGVLLYDTTGNTVSQNRIRNNGPWAGVSILIASNNIVEQNQIVGNNMSLGNTSGIRVENLGTIPSNSNIIRGNLVQSSALDGIELFRGASNNRISQNNVLQNNRDGINAFADSKNNIIEDNQVRNNGFGPLPGSGIYMRGGAFGVPPPSGNLIRRNVAFGNKEFDLRDAQPNCGTNIWTANQAATGTPPCVFNP